MPSSAMRPLSAAGARARHRSLLYFRPDIAARPGLRSVIGVFAIFLGSGVLVVVCWHLGAGWMLVPVMFGGGWDRLRGQETGFGWCDG